MLMSIRSFARSVFYFFHICLDKIRGVDFYTYKDCPPIDYRYWKPLRNIVAPLLPLYKRKCIHCLP